MSKTIDERVVSMQFDNAKFEKNVQTSIGTLEKLKEALHFDKIDMSSVVSNIEKITEKVTGMHGVLDIAFERINSKIVDIGQSIANNFIINPPTDGFKEYELKMDSLKVIMESSHESLETVNKYLNELNKYSDQTIYSFSDMTSSIGKFTNAGVDLNTAVNAIKGIANEAALAGASTNDASRAMYNFAQALSAGSVKLIDWKSIENANMATQEFKNELIKTAVELGTLKKSGDDYISTTTNMQGKISETFNATKGFNDSLAYQWMTTDVLTTTLGRYADANTDVGARATKAATEVRTFSAMMDALKEAVGSGWATTWELIFGNMEEATEMWTKVNDVLSGFIDKFSDARNDLLKGWREDNKQIDGRKILLQGLGNVFKIVTNVIKPFSDAMKVLFPPMTSKTLLDLTVKFTDFTNKVRKATENFPMKLFDPLETSRVKKGFDAASERGEKFAKSATKGASIIDKAVDSTSKKTDKATKDSVKNLKVLREAVKATINGDYGNDADRIERLKKAGFDPDYVQKYVDKLYELSDGTWDLSDSSMKAAEKALGISEKAHKTSKKTEESAKSAMDTYEIEVAEIMSNGNLLTSILISIGSAIKNTFGTGKAILGAFADAWSESESPIKITLSQLTYFDATLKHFSKGIQVSDKTLNQIKESFKGLFTAVKTVIDSFMAFGIRVLPTIVDIFKSIIRVAGGVVLGIMSLVGSIASAIAKSNILTNVSNVLYRIFAKLRDIVKSAADVIGFFGEKLNKAATYVKNYVKQHETLDKIASAIPSLFDKASSKIRGFGKKLGNALGIKNVDEFKKKVDGAISTLSQDFLIPGFERFMQFIEDILSGNMSIDKAVDFFKDFGKGLKDFAKTIFAPSDGPSLLDKIGEFTSKLNVGSAFGKIKGVFESVGSIIRGFFDGLFGKSEDIKVEDGPIAKLETVADKGEKAKENIESVTKGIASALETLNLPFKNVGSMGSDADKAVSTFTKLSDAAKLPVGDKIKTFGETISDGFGKAITKITEFLSKVDFKKLLVAVKAVKTVTSIINGIKLAKSFSGMADNIGGFFEKLSDGISFSLVPEESKVAKLLKVAAAIFLVAKSMAMIAEIPKERLGIAVGVVAGIAAVMAGIVIAFEKIKPVEGSNLDGAAKTMLGLAIGVLLISKALISLSREDPNAIITGGVSIAIIVYVLSKAVQSLNEVKVDKAAVAAPIAFAIALKLLCKTMSEFGNMKPGVLLQGGAVIFIMLGLLTASVQELDKLNVSPAAVAAPLAFAAALGLLLAEIVAYSLIPTILLIKGHVVILITLAILSYAVKSLDGLNVSPGAVVAPIAFAVALGLLVASIFALGFLPADKFDNAFISLIKLAGVLAAFVILQGVLAKYTPSIGMSDVVGIVAFALALDMLAVAAIGLGMMPADRLARGVEAVGWLGAIVIALGITMAVLTKISTVDKSNIIGLIAAVGAIMLLGTSVVLLGLLPRNSLIKGVLAVAAIGAVIAAMEYVLVKASKEVNISAMNMAGMIAAVVAIQLLGTAVMLLGLLPGKVLLKGVVAVAAIGAVIAAMEYVLVKASKEINISGMNILGMIAAVLAIKMLAINVLALGILPAKVLLKGVLTIAALGAVLSGIMYVMGTMALNVADVLGVIAVVAAVIVLTQAVQKLSEMENMAQGVFGIITIMIGLAVAIGILATFAEPIVTLSVAFVIFAAGAVLVAVAFNLIAGAMMGFVKALDAFSKIDMGAIVIRLLMLVPTLVLLAAAFAVFAVGSVLAFAGLLLISAGIMKLVFALTALVGVNMLVILQQVLLFIPTLIILAAAVGAISVLLLAASVGFIALGTGVFLLGAGLLMAATAMTMFTGAAVGIKDIGVILAEGASSIAEHAAEIASGIGSMIVKGIAYVGEHAGELVAKLGQMLGKAKAAIIEKAPEFLAKGKELAGKLAAGIAANGPQILATIVNVITNGLSFIISHIPEWAAKGAELIGKLAEGIATNAPKVLEKVQEGLSKATAYFSKEIPKWVKAGGDLVLGFLKGIGKNIKDTPKKVKELGTTAINALREKLKINSPSKVFEELGEGTGEGYIKGVDSTGDDVGKSTASLGDKAQSGFLGAISGLADKFSSLFSDTKSTVESGSSELANAGSNSMEQFALGVESAIGKVGTVATSGINSALNAVGSVSSKWSPAGRKLIEALAKGITSGGSKVGTNSKNAAKKGAEGAKSTKNKWTDVGKALADGLAKGVKDHSSKIESAAKSAAERAYKAAKNKLGVKSPSRVFARLGKFVDLGLAKGISDNSGAINSSAKAMAEKLITTAERALIPVAELMNSNMIDDPVIKPVLDLSDFQNGSNRLYSMMSDMDRYSLHGNVDLATDTSFSVGRERQSRRDRDDDVLSALIDGLKELKRQNNEPHGNTYIIDGITYDDGSNVANAIGALIRAAKVGGRA